MKQQTLTGKTVEELDMRVQNYLDKGWKVHGVPLVKDNLFYQVMLYGVEEPTTQSDDVASITPNRLATLALYNSIFRRRRGRYPL